MHQFKAYFRTDTPTGALMGEGVFAIQTQWVLWMENDSCLKLAQGSGFLSVQKGPRDIELCKFELERLRCFKTFDRRRIYSTC